ncbi:MAG: branched-chain amino acid ABC transporter permease [Blautia massiliensis (ex Durand et al. 2017)]|nr:MAG: branched-chain amino acid ABC transporter permease [Subdoligranulum variabile]
MQFLSYLINGISLGSVYALIALGYTMVYGIAKMLNFAHGDVIMIGSYVVFFTFGLSGMNPILSILLSMVVCTILGVTIERVAYRPLREAPSLAVLITAIGVSYLLQQVAQLSWGSDPKSFISIVSKSEALEPVSLFDGQLTISVETILTIVVCLVIMAALMWFINNTSAGHAMRAVSEDRGAAQLMGVNVNATISLTFAIGSALAAVAGALLCSSYPTLQPTTGAMPGIKAFVAAVFGGIGSIPGAFLGGILLGIIENLSKAYISTQLSDAIVFLVLIVVLLVKPTGLLGKKVHVKV